MMASYVIIYNVRNVYVINLEVYRTLSFNLNEAQIQKLLCTNHLQFHNCSSQQSCNSLNTQCFKSVTMCCIPFKKNGRYINRLRLTYQHDIYIVPSEPHFNNIKF